MFVDPPASRRTSSICCWIALFSESVARALSTSTWMLDWKATNEIVCDSGIVSTIIFADSIAVSSFSPSIEALQSKTRQMWVSIPPGSESRSSDSGQMFTRHFSSVSTFELGTIGRSRLASNASSRDTSYLSFYRSRAGLPAQVMRIAVMLSSPPRSLAATSRFHAARAG